VSLGISISPLSTILFLQDFPTVLYFLLCILLSWWNIYHNENKKCTNKREPAKMKFTKLYYLQSFFCWSFNFWIEYISNVMAGHNEQI
jgi:hypothetical protein